MSIVKTGILFFIFVSCCTSCGLGMLLFCRESKTKTIYKSSSSKKDYYIIKATTLSHCGCTNLAITNYKNGKKTFIIDYTNNRVSKTVYRLNTITNTPDTQRLLATNISFYTTPFDSLDNQIFRTIDSLNKQKIKGFIYPVTITEYKGFINNPY